MVLMYSVGKRIWYNPLINRTRPKLKRKKNFYIIFKIQSDEKAKEITTMEHPEYKSI